MFDFLTKRKPAEKWVMIAVDKNGQVWPFEQGEQFHLGGNLTVDGSRAVLARGLSNGRAEVISLSTGDEILNQASGFAPFKVSGVAREFRNLR